MSNKQNGWVGVDLDGTLATYGQLENWDGVSIGEPIPAMIERVKWMIAQGLDVRIVTARAADVTWVCDTHLRVAESYRGCEPKLPGITAPCQCRRSDALPGISLPAVGNIQEWCEKHIGKRLPVQFWKDGGMIHLFDDRAIQVIANEGTLVTDHAVHALGVAEAVYKFAMQNRGQVPPNLWEALRSALGIPAPEKSRIIVP